MKFEQTGLEGIQIKFEDLDETMSECGFDRAWDYERATYDYKMIDQVEDATYYLRMPCFVIEGEIPKADTTVELMTPYVGKHYYPHGVEYDEDFPQKIVDKCHKKIGTVTEKIQADKLS
ncbi:YugN family protein [Salisediminibacterium selenitireducens]|uniref:YugN-like family protein n=1 Tax=Bacillus selenitireducens (strain ATCC 700615 / DSM 15326 / MLS10) TaxID=439292 RepID=D6XTK3_BACIE|nr:YugN family protein [Salisediminibacterium selenitireducens]ADH99139.1 hypothetical protein Bsel_1630 [[Bacillus] selenitireducens MLS10]